MDLKKILFPVMAASLAFGAAAQSLDPASRAVLRRQTLAERQVSADRPSVKRLSRAVAEELPGESPMIPALIELSDGATPDMLAGEGVEILGSRHGFVFATVSADAARRLDISPAVRTMELNRRRDLKMDIVREVTGVNSVHQGIDLPRAYTGKGVVCGVVDAGFDPNHPNFLNADGTSRFGYFALVGPNAAGTAVNVSKQDPTKLYNFTSDDRTTFHGTHTTGIMAGSYRGTALTAQVANYPSSMNVEKDCPYYGIAYDAEIAASSGTSYDAFIAYALDGILEWRWNERHDAPIVVNMSIGGNQGPHDGSSDICRFLDACAEYDNAVICVAAGNEGDIPLAVTKTFTEGDLTLGTGINPFVYGADKGNVRYGLVEIYSDDATPFEMQAVIYNKSRGRVICRMPMSNTVGSSIQYWCSDYEFQASSEDIVDANFARAFDGYVGVVPAVDPNTGRFYAAIDIYTQDNVESNANGNYVLGFEITGQAGHSVYAYTDGQFVSFASLGIDGWVDGSTDGTISDVACGSNTISVGSCDARSRIASLGGMCYENADFVPGNITYYSSYATMPDGRTLPHLCAPGATVISSASTPFMSNASNYIGDGDAQAMVAGNTRNSYYLQMHGTSMATPVVAGTAALMLEANPNLSFGEVRDILMQTAASDDCCAANPAQAGAGKLDSHAAVKRAVESSGIADIVADRGQRPLVKQDAGRQLLISLPGADGVKADVFDLSGRRVASAAAPRGSELGVDASSLAPGVYVLKVNSAQAMRFLVK